MNVLVVKANNRPAAEGISSKMYETFIQEIEKANHLNVTTFDVFEEDMPYFGQDFFNALGKLQTGEDLTDTEQRIVLAKQRAKDAFSAADVVVIAFPLWNFTIPAALQTFMDYIAEAGYTFKYDAEGNLHHLMPEKKIILLNARGNVYSDPELKPMEMAVNYLKNMFAGMFGMELIDEVIIEGHNAMPDKAEKIIEEGLRKVEETASSLAYQHA